MYAYQLTYLLFVSQVSKSKSLKKMTKILYVIVFSITIPLGIGIGIGLQNTPSDNRELVSAVCEAFATGNCLGFHNSRIINRKLKP